jgi:hypothetical protein
MSGCRRNFCDFGRRRIDFCDLAKAVGLGIMRAGDKSSTHFCTVPAGDDAKPKRLLSLDVTRRKIGHGATAFRLAFDPLSSAERLLRLFGEQPFAQLSSESRAKSESTAATRSRWRVSAGANPAAYKFRT